MYVFGQAYKTKYSIIPDLWPACLVPGSSTLLSLLSTWVQHHLNLSPPGALFRIKAEQSNLNLSFVYAFYITVCVYTWSHHLTHAETHQGWILKWEGWRVTTSTLQYISQESCSVCSHIRMHHPASSCADNMVRDSGEGGAVVGREKGCVCLWGRGEGGD